MAAGDGDGPGGIAVTRPEVEGRARDGIDMKAICRRRPALHLHNVRVRSFLRHLHMRAVASVPSDTGSAAVLPVDEWVVRANKKYFEPFFQLKGVFFDYEGALVTYYTFAYVFHNSKSSNERRSKV